MVNSYILGRSREYNLLSKLRKNNWFAIRGAGSKAGMVKVNDKKYFPIDIVSIKKDKGKMTKIWFIQVSKYLTDIDKIEKKYLLEWAIGKGATPVIAWTFDKRSTKNKKRGNWQFFNLKTEKFIECHLKDSNLSSSKVYRDGKTYLFSA